MGDYVIVYWVAHCYTGLHEIDIEIDNIKSSAALQDDWQALHLSKSSIFREMPESNTFSGEQQLQFRWQWHKQTTWEGGGGGRGIYLAAVQSPLVSVRLENINWQARAVVSAKNSIPRP